MAKEHEKGRKESRHSDEKEDKALIRKMVKPADLKDVAGKKKEHSK